MPASAGIYYFSSEEEHWDRPAVILLHGAGGNHLFWPPEIRRMEGQRIYAIDLPGHGKSEGIGRQVLRDYADAVLDFMDGLKIRKAVFVGHSMGGGIAQTLGIHHPSRTLGLGLVATAPRLRVAPEIISNASASMTFPIAVGQIIEGAFGPQADPRLKETAAKRMLETRSSVLYSDFLACDTFDVSDRLGRIKAPTLIISGSYDRMTPPAFSQTMQMRIKNALLHQIDGAGHMVMLEQPQVVANLLKLFLNRIVYQPGE